MVSETLEPMPVPTVPQGILRKPVAGAAFVASLATLERVVFRPTH
jgi:hypothetical protein